MQMLQYFRYDFSLSRSVLLPHGPVHQFDDVLVEVVDEVIQVLLMGLWSQALSTNPFHIIPKIGLKQK